MVTGETIIIKKKIVHLQSTHFPPGKDLCRATFCQLMFWCNVFSSEILPCKPHGTCPSRKQVTVNPPVLYALWLSRYQEMEFVLERDSIVT